MRKLKKVLRPAWFEPFSDHQVAAAREEWKRKQAGFEEQETEYEQETAG